MPKTLRVDIGIPTFRRPDTLHRAVETALTQKTGSLEVRVFVVCNDPDRDLSGLRSRYSIETYSNSSNLGLVGNLNRVIELTQSEYLVILHDDDELLPGSLQKNILRLEETPEAGMSFSAVYITDSKDRIARIFRPFPHPRVFSRSPGALALLNAFMPIKAAGVIYRSADIASAGGFRPEFEEMTDIGLYLRMGLRHRILYNSEPSAKYYFDAGNLTHTVMFQSRDARMFSIIRDSMADELEKSGIPAKAWDHAFSRMAMRHGILSALHRLAASDKTGAVMCLNAVLAKGVWQGSIYGLAAWLMRAMMILQGTAKWYSMARKIQSALAAMRGRHK